MKMDILQKMISNKEEKVIYNQKMLLKKLKIVIYVLIAKMKFYYNLVIIQDFVKIVLYNVLNKK